MLLCTMKTLISFLLSFILIPVDAQTGVYRLSNKNGASCTIAVRKNNSQITGDVFAWWNTPSGTHGTFSGQGTLKNNVCLLTSQEQSSCKIKLDFEKNSLNAVFYDCIAENLPEDFKGNYQKITTQIPGDYLIKTDKAYFYKVTKSNSRLQTYLLKGDKVHIDLENIIDDKWVFINYTNTSGKTSSGYMLWQEIKTYP